MATPSKASERVLLVEGIDDEHVVRHLCKRAGIADRFTLIDKKGIERLLESISGEMKVSGRVALGIIVDANNDIAGRWQAITDQLKRKGIAIPSNPPARGLVTNSRPRVGVG